MGLVGYNERDRKNNESMYESLSSFLGMSYFKREKLKDVTPTNTDNNKPVKSFIPETILPPEYETEFSRELMSLASKYRAISRCAVLARDNSDESIIEAILQYRKIIEMLIRIFNVTVTYYEEDFWTLLYPSVFDEKVSKRKLCLFYRAVFLCKVDVAYKITEEDRAFRKEYEMKKKKIHKLKDEMKQNAVALSTFDKIARDVSGIVEVENLQNLFLEKQNELEESIVQIEQYLLENEQKYNDIICLFKSEKI